jgi:hypothetical protein
MASDDDNRRVTFVNVFLAMVDGLSAEVKIDWQRTLRINVLTSVMKETSVLTMSRDLPARFEIAADHIDFPNYRIVAKPVIAAVNCLCQRHAPPHVHASPADRRFIARRHAEARCARRASRRNRRASDKQLPAPLRARARVRDSVKDRPRAPRHSCAPARAPGTARSR